MFFLPVSLRFTFTSTWLPLRLTSTVNSALYSGSCSRTLGHEEHLINAWGHNYGLVRFRGAPVTNSLYCVTRFNGHKSGWPSTWLTQHLHHSMTVGFFVLGLYIHSILYMLEVYCCQVGVETHLHLYCLIWRVFEKALGIAMGCILFFGKRKRLIPDVHNLIQWLQSIGNLHELSFIFAGTWDVEFHTCFAVNNSCYISVLYECNLCVTSVYAD